MKKRKSITVLTLLLALAAAAALALQTGLRAPNFKLTDQFNKIWSLDAQKGVVTALIVADRDSGRAMGSWVDNLKTKYGSKIQVLGLLDLHSVPGIGRGIARSRIKSETKDPLMLDFDGNISKQYGVSSKNPAAVVIDKNGIVRAVETSYSAATFGNATSAIDAALKAKG